MAPSPQHDSEPKAPDKSGAATAQQSSSDPRNTPAPSTSTAQLSEGKHVDGLDDGQLKALLDEAITYKCPKDREGKSSLFKELLEEAEQDEEEEGGGGAGGGGWRGARDTRSGRRGRRGERLPHSSSLQDLVAAALAADVAPQRRSRHAPVSTRTQHGGSLPSGVDRSFQLGEEPMRGGGGGGADYIATVRCVNPPPLTERRVSVSDAHCSGTEMEVLNRRSKIPCTSVTYTSRATLDINSVAGRAHTTTTCSNQVRTAAPPCPPSSRRRRHRRRNAQLHPDDPQLLPHNHENLKQPTDADGLRMPLFDTHKRKATSSQTIHYYTSFDDEALNDSTHTKNNVKKKYRGRKKASGALPRTFPKAEPEHCEAIYPEATVLFPYYIDGCNDSVKEYFTSGGSFSQSNVEKIKNKLNRLQIVHTVKEERSVASTNSSENEGPPVCTIQNSQFKVWSLNEDMCVYPQYCERDPISIIKSQQSSKVSSHDETCVYVPTAGAYGKFQGTIVPNLSNFSTSAEKYKSFSSSSEDVLAHSLGNIINDDKVNTVYNDLSKLQQSGLRFPATASHVKKVERDIRSDTPHCGKAEGIERDQHSNTCEVEKHVQIVDKIDFAKEPITQTAGTRSDDRPLDTDSSIVNQLKEALAQLNSSRSFQLVKSKNNTGIVGTTWNVEAISSSGSETSFNIMQTTEQVDSGITFGCITTPAVVTSCNTTSSAPSPCASVDSKPRSVITTSINGLASISRNYGAAGSSSADDFKKMDENGNALQTFNLPHSGSSQHKKPRKKKSSKNETVAMSEQIDGYQGNKELSEVLRFIESDAEHGRSHKHKHHDDDKAGKKRSTERRTKDKADKIQRANSMEELSLTKLEDLTHDKGKGELSLRKHKKERVSDGGDNRKCERRSWGDESSRTPYFHSNSEEPQTHESKPASVSTQVLQAQAPAPREKKNKSKQNKSSEWPPVDMSADPPLEILEFQTVTKKKRTRKRHSPHEANRGGANGAAGSDRSNDILYRKIRAPSSPDRRRKSAPPSDKSNDSNDDLDSVHSLPAEPTAERCAVRPGSASSGGTPQASYADIARTRHNIPDLIESCNFYTDLEPPVQIEEKPQRRKEIVCRSDSAPIETRRTPPKTAEEVQVGGPTYDVENYPALETRGHRTLPRAKETKHSTAPSPPKQTERRTKPPVEPAVVEQKPAVSAQVTEDRVEVSSEPPDVVLAPDRRPAVILLDEASRPLEMDGITFGFDINEQLLNGEHREMPATPLPFPSSDEFPAINEKRQRARCDLVGEGLPAGSVSVRAGRASLRYLPPAPLSSAECDNLEKLASFVNSVWEDTVKLPSGKRWYFSQ